MKAIRDKIRIMRLITLKVLPVDKAYGSGVGLDYREQLQNVLRLSSVAGGGLSTDEVIEAVRISEIMNQAKNNKLYLEESDYKILLNKVEGYQRWGIALNEVATFVEDIRGAPEVEVEKVKEKKA